MTELKRLAAERLRADSGDAAGAGKSSPRVTQYSTERKPPICVITRWAAAPKRTRLGFADVSWPSTGIELLGVALHVAGPRKWIQFPCRTWVDQDGNAHRAPALRVKDDLSRQLARDVFAAFSEY